MLSVVCGKAKRPFEGPLARNITQSCADTFAAVHHARCASIRRPYHGFIVGSALQVRLPLRSASAAVPPEATAGGAGATDGEVTVRTRTEKLLGLPGAIYKFTRPHTIRGDLSVVAKLEFRRSNSSRMCSHLVALIAKYEYAVANLGRLRMECASCSVCRDHPGIHHGCSKSLD